MAWADRYIADLKEGKTVQFRPRDNSMYPRIKSGQLVEVKPIAAPPVRGDIVLCEVNGSQYLHQVKAVGYMGWQIGNMRGRINGWTKKVYGVLTTVDPDPQDGSTATKVSRNLT